MDGLSMSGDCGLVGNSAPGVELRLRRRLRACHRAIRPPAARPATPAESTAVEVPPSSFEASLFEDGWAVAVVLGAGASVGGDGGAFTAESASMVKV